MSDGMTEAHRDRQLAESDDPRSRPLVQNRYVMEAIHRAQMDTLGVIQNLAQEVRDMKESVVKVHNRIDHIDEPWAARVFRLASEEPKALWTIVGIVGALVGIALFALNSFDPEHATHLHHLVQPQAAPAGGVKP